MADGAHRVGSSGIEKGGVVAVHVIAGCPGGQSRKNVLARGEVCVLIHHVNAKQTTTPCLLLHSTLASMSTKTPLPSRLLKPAPKGKSVSSAPSLTPSRLWSAP